MWEIAKCYALLREFQLEAVDIFLISMYNLGVNKAGGAIYMTFGEKVQRLRKLNNLSQDQLAEKLNVSRQAISKWELGAMPDIENVIKISHYFDCSLDYLLNNEITDENRNAKENMPAEAKKEIGPETFCVVISIISMISIAALWIASKFVDVGIHRQDAATGYWYTGFSGFIDYFGLYGLLYGLIFILMFSIAARAYIQLFRLKKASSKGFLICRLVSLLLYIVGIVWWIYCVMQPWTFLWSPITYIAVSVYCLLTIMSSIVTFQFGRR